MTQHKWTINYACTNPACCTDVIQKNIKCTQEDVPREIVHHVIEKGVERCGKACHATEIWRDGNKEGRWWK